MSFESRYRRHQKVCHLPMKHIDLTLCILQVLSNMLLACVRKQILQMAFPITHWRTLQQSVGAILAAGASHITCCTEVVAAALTCSAAYGVTMLDAARSPDPRS